MAIIWEYGWRVPGKNRGALLGYVCINTKCRRYNKEINK